MCGIRHTECAAYNFTVADRLKDHERVQALGGPVFLGGLAADVPTSSHITQYAAMVRDRSRRRQLIAVGQKITSLGHTENQSADELRVGRSDAVLRAANRL